MKNTILKTFMVGMLSVLPVGMIYAMPACQKPEKTFILRFTSKNPGVSFNAHLMVMTNQGSHVTGITRVTPFETTATGNFVGLMLQSGTVNPEIKLELLEKKEAEENILLSGTGHDIFAHEDSDGMGYVTAR
jgi:hypothetical protein